jgi:hypothetical protein
MKSTTIEYVELSGKVLKETDKAALIHFSVVDETHWIPLSQVSEIHNDPETPTVVIASWIASKKGLI